MDDKNKPANSIELPDGELDDPTAASPQPDTETTEETDTSDKPIEGIVASRRRLREILRPSEIMYWLRSRKSHALLVIGLALLGVLLSIPMTRYKIAALGLKNTVQVSVVDSSTSKPLDNVTVQSGGVTAKTNADGTVLLRVKVGQCLLVVTRPKYRQQTRNIFIPISHPVSRQQIALVPKHSR